MTALMAPIALSTRPLFSACSASIRSSRPLRASTYFDASVSTTAFCLSLTSDSSWSNLSPISLAASDPDLLQVGGERLDVRRDLGAALGDPLLGGGEVAAHDVGDP